MQSHIMSGFSGIGYYKVVDEAKKNNMAKMLSL